MRSIPYAKVDCSGHELEYVKEVLDIIERTVYLNGKEVKNESK